MVPSDQDDNLSEFHDIVSVEMFSGIVDNLNSMIDGVKVGEIATIMVVAGMTPPLDSTIWVECEGGTVTDPQSILFGQTIPDLRDRYLKGATALSTVGTLDGSNTADLSHNHGGATQPFGPGPHVAEEADDYWEAVAHTHTIDTDLAADANIEPAHFTIKHYLKVK